MSRNWYVYILGCADGTYYTGITIDVVRRIAEHNSARGGSHYTRPRRPVKLLVAWQVDEQGPALEVEHYIKHRLPRTEKQQLISNPEILASLLPTINLHPLAMDV